MVETATAVAADVSGVVKTYRTATGAVTALDDVSASFPASTVTALVGPSGSGKSSLLRLLACVDRPDTGRVVVAGTDVTRLGARARRVLRRRQVGYLFQNPADNLLEYLTAFEHLAFAARLRGSGTDADADRLLDALGLSHRKDNRPRQLSGGEQQRLAIATAVIGRPALVIADEPTAELDHASGELVMDAMLALRDEGVGFVVASHDPLVVGRVDLVVELHHGHVVGDDRWRSVGDDRWQSVGDDRWRSVGDDRWQSAGDDRWPSVQEEQ
jgi:ABC-type lipoprotein export system ATPase subunit